MDRKRIWLACLLAALALPLAIALTACAHVDPMGSVTFPNGHRGWVTGWNGQSAKMVVMRTTDGGASWTCVGARRNSRHAYVVSWAEFFTPTRGVWAVDLNKLVYTRTGGRPWKVATVRRANGKRFTTPGYFRAASFANASVGWATITKYVETGGESYETGGWIAKTRNGGATWRIQKRVVGKNITQKYAGGFSDVASPTTRVCYALKTGYRGGVWATKDGGATWNRRVLPGDTRTYEALDFVDAMTGWAVGGNGMVAKTTDGGRTWVAQVSGTTERLHGVGFWSADFGYAVGEHGTILATRDGGATWMPQASGIVPDPNVEGDNPIINDVDCVSATEAWAVREIGWMPGQSGTLVHTTDGGQTWTLVQ